MVRFFEFQGRVSTFAMVALVGSACSDPSEPSSDQSNGISTSEQTAAGEGRSTIVVDSTTFNSTASLSLNTRQLDDRAERSLAFYTKLDTIEISFSISPFPEEATEARMPVMVTGGISEDGVVRTFSTGAASITEDDELWTVHIEGNAVDAKQVESPLNLVVSGTIQRQCFVEGEPQTPQAISQDGQKAGPELILDREWSTPFCQSQLL